MMAVARDSWTAFSNWALVIWISLPQLLSRFTRGSKMMFLLYLLEPLVFVAVVYAIRGVLKQNLPNYGTSLFLFYASGCMPYFLFVRISSRTRATKGVQNSLLPGTTALDAYIATAILDALLNIATTVLVFYCMWLSGINEAKPASIVVCAAPFALLLVLGLGIGMINSAIGDYLPFWPQLYGIMTRGLIFLSGVLFVVDLLPPWLRDVIVLNPVSHGVDWFRLGVYGRYPHNTLDKAYLIEWALIALFLGFVIDRATLRQPARR
jgi:capsular polysaccharide transport system permease protein